MQIQMLSRTRRERDRCEGSRCIRVGQNSFRRVILDRRSGRLCGNAVMAAALAVVAARTSRVATRTTASAHFAAATDLGPSAATTCRRIAAARRGPRLGTAASHRGQSLERERDCCEPDQYASDEVSSSPHGKKLAHLHRCLRLERHRCSNQSAAEKAFCSPSPVFSGSNSSLGRHSYSKETKVSEIHYSQSRQTGQAGKFAK